MKRILVSSLAALTLMGSLAGVANAQPRNDHGRWDNHQYNGYMYRGQWRYGQPSAQVMRDRSYSPGYHNWRRGDRLSAYERAHYRQVDYRRSHLRAPPRGYHYVRSDRGELLLVGIATGVILSVIANS